MEQDLLGNNDCGTASDRLEDRAKAAYRRRHKRLTPQRLAVLHALADLSDHPTTEQVHARVARSLPRVSLRTVYAALHELQAMGVVQVLAVGFGAVRWDPDPRPHAHLACSRCGTLFNLPVDPMVLAPLARRAARSNILMHAVLTFYGVCARCRG